MTAVIGNTTVSPNPYRGIATSGVVVFPGYEKTAQDMKFEGTFNAPVDSVSVMFLNEGSFL